MGCEELYPFSLGCMQNHFPPKGDLHIYLTMHRRGKGLYMRNNQGQELLDALAQIKKALIRSHIIAGIPQPGLMAMRTIRRSQRSNADISLQGVKMSDISRYLDISKPAVTQIVNDLEKRGYVERVLTKNDRRLVCVRITEDGDKILDRGEEEYQEKLMQVTEILGEQDTHELIRIITKLSGALEKVSVPIPMEEN